MIQPYSDTTSSFIGPLPDYELLVEKTPVVSLFEGHLLADKNDLTFLEKHEAGTGFGFSILLICFVLLIYIHRNSEGFVASVIKAAFDRNLASQDARLDNTQRSRSLFLTQLVAILSIALFSSTVYPNLIETDLKPFEAFLWAIGLIVNVALLKRLIQWLLALIFDLQAEMRFHRFSSNILTAMAGLTLLPVSIFLIYTPQLPVATIMVLGSCVLGFFYIKGLLRGFQLTALDKAISPLYLFYYFCALELLPVFVLIRVAISL